MKRVVLFCTLFLLLNQLEAQTLFTYGKHSVSKSEFLKAYNKNGSVSGDHKETPEEYLNLYILFKLKVQDAKDHHLDTLPALKADVLNFRNQVVNHFLFDKKELDFLTAQALTRSKKDIHLTAYYVSGNDSLKSKTIASKLAGQLKKGKTSAPENAGDEISKEDFGFITVFSLPYAIENIVYNLSPGQYSEPFKSGNGYYIFKNESERPAIGKMQLAQILIAAAPNDDASWSGAKKLADSIYDAIRNGANFGELAKEFSNDRSTFMNGGQMQEFSVGKYSPDFETHIYELKSDSQVLKPFASAFGYHIIKRISANPVPQTFNEDYTAMIRQQVMNDLRVNIAKEKLLQTATINTGFKQNRVSIPDIYTVTDTSLISNKNIKSGNVDEKTIVFTFKDGSKTTIGDWNIYVRNSGKVVGGQLHQSYDKLWPEFRNEMILENYRKHLEDFDPEFAAQMQEFKDGNMLFEIMQRKVWNKAGNDTAALKDYYQTHLSEYKWDESADAVIFSCTNETVADLCRNELIKENNWRKVLLDHSSEAQADSGRFEITQLPLNGNKAKPGITEPVVNKFDGTATFVAVLKLYHAGLQRSFEDARGLVINDYQNILEEKWTNELRKKYPVKVNEKIMESLKQH